VIATRNPASRAGRVSNRFCLVAETGSKSSPALPAPQASSALERSLRLSRRATGALDLRSLEVATRIKDDGPAKTAFVFLVPLAVPRWGCG
jgi:hypothetical protein